MSANRQLAEPTAEGLRLVAIVISLGLAGFSLMRLMTRRRPVAVKPA